MFQSSKVLLVLIYKMHFWVTYCFYFLRNLLITMFTKYFAKQEYQSIKDHSMKSWLKNLACSWTEILNLESNVEKVYKIEYIMF